MRKKHDFAKFVHKRLEWSLVDNSPEQSETVWLCTYVAGYRSLTSTNLHACDSHQRPSWRSHTPVCSDSVTRVTIFGVSYSTRVLLRKLVTGFESRFSQNDSTRVTVNDSSQSHFSKIAEFLVNKPSSFAHKEMSIFASMMINFGTNFLSPCLVVLCYILRIKCPQLAQR